MRTLEELLDSVRESGARLTVDVAPARLVPSDLDDIFHVPLISTAILVAAHFEKGLLATREMSRWAAGILSEHCFGASDAIRRYQWSMVLRERSAEALIFLEAAELVAVSRDDERTIASTESGRKFIRDGLADEDEWGSLTRGLVVAYRSARARGLTLI